MAVAFDASSQGGANPSSSNSWNHTTSGTNRVILIMEVTNAASDITTAPTYNGVTATLVKRVRTPSGNFQSVWFIAGDANVTSGTHSVTINASGGANALYGIALSYNGADGTQAHMVANATSNTGTTVTSLTGNQTTTVNSSMMAMFTNNTASQATAGAGATSRQVNTSIDVGTQAFDNGSAASGSISETFNFSSGNASWIMAQIEPPAPVGNEFLHQTNQPSNHWANSQYPL